MLERCTFDAWISIHAPRVGSDAVVALVRGAYLRFQSTLPVWGATRSSGSLTRRPMRFQSTLPVWGATRRPGRSSRGAGGFQSTLPVWGATRQGADKMPACVISIHAPRVGSDDRIRWPPPQPTYFNPRSPCGERPPAVRQCGQWHPISIHAPRVGSDWVYNTHRKRPKKFQSTLPVWGATLLWPQRPGSWRFQSTLPVWGATLGPGLSPPGKTISIHAPRVGSDSCMS